jgi:hypothetical protein
MEPAKSKKLSSTEKNILAITVIGGLLLLPLLPSGILLLGASLVVLWFFHYLFGLKSFPLLLVATLGVYILSRSAELLFIAFIIGAILCYHWLPSASNPSEKPEPFQTPTDRLRILEEAYRQKLITEQEYLEKRQQILADF